MSAPLKDLKRAILGRSQLLEESFCWLWQGARIGKKAYGKIMVKGRLWLAHRLAYAVFREAAELEGRQIHHECLNKACVNPGT